MKIVYSYTIIVERKSVGGYHVFRPALKGCHSQGEIYDKALANITEAVEVYIESLLEDGEPVLLNFTAAQP
jgi:predicted RNase H-like HicB family nuclease